jgi:hypothetical protein
MVEKRGAIVDQTEVATSSGLQIYITLEANHCLFPVHSISRELYFWNYHNLINYFGISKYKLAKN